MAWRRFVNRAPAANRPAWHQMLFLSAAMIDNPLPPMHQWPRCATSPRKCHAKAECQENGGFGKISYPQRVRLGRLDSIQDFPLSEEMAMVGMGQIYCHGPRQRKGPYCRSAGPRAAMAAPVSLVRQGVMVAGRLGAQAKPGAGQ